MKNIKTFKNILCVVCALHLVGCSCFVPWNQEFIVSGTPSDAKVSIAGEGTRKSGGMYSLRRNRAYHGIVSREGYQEEHFYVMPHLNGFGVLDIVGGCCWFIPLVGLGFPGSHSLDRDHYLYDLKPVVEEK